MMDQEEPKPLPGGDNLYAGEFSPDGQWIAAFTAGANATLTKIPVTGGTPISLADAPSANGLTWEDDGSIVFGTSKGLMRTSSSGGTSETLTTLDSKKGETSHATPHFLPGAKALLFTIGSGTGNRSRRSI